MKKGVSILSVIVLTVIFLCSHSFEGNDIISPSENYDPIVVPLQFNQAILDNLVHLQSANKIDLGKLLTSVSSAACFAGSEKTFPFRDMYCVTDATYWSLKQAVDDSLAKISRNRKCTEHNWLAMLELLDIEIILASYQLMHQKIEIAPEILECRNEHIRSLPNSLKQVYEKIIALAQFDPQHTHEVVVSDSKKKKTPMRYQGESRKKTMFGKQERCALNRIRGTCEHYYLVVHAMQNQTEKTPHNKSESVITSSISSKKRVHSAPMLKKFNFYRHHLLWI
jgi:hypothetical protein